MMFFLLLLLALSSGVKVSFSKKKKKFAFSNSSSFSPCAFSSLSSSNAVVVKRYSLVPPNLGKSYKSNHWFHVSEFHTHAHSRLRARRRRRRKEEKVVAKKTEEKVARGYVVVVLTVPERMFLRALSPTTRFLLAVSYCEDFRDEGGFEEVAFRTDGPGGVVGEEFVVSRKQSPRRRFVESFRGESLEESFSSFSSSSLSSFALCAMEKDGGKFGGNSLLNGMVEVVDVEPPENYAYARGDGSDDDEKMNGALEKTLLEGSFGGVHVDRGAWMPNAGDSESIREAIKYACAPMPSKKSLLSEDGAFYAAENDDDDEEEKTRASKGGRNAENSDSLDGCLRVASQIRTHESRSSSENSSSSSSSSSDRKSNESGEVKLALVYNRNAGRAIDDAQSVRAKLEELLNLSEKKRRNGAVARWRVLVLTHDEKNPPCLLSKCVGSASLVLTPHGFQSMLAIFMSENALLYEVFPSRYYKHGYKRFALEFNLAHGYSQSKPVGFVSNVIARFFTTDGCMKMYYCRYLSRKASVDVDDAMLARIVHAVSMQSQEGEEGEEETLSSPPIVDLLPNRVQCNWRCAGDIACQKFAYDERLKTCRFTRVDRRQKEHANAGGDVIGRGIYDQKCFVLGC